MSKKAHHGFIRRAPSAAASTLVASGLAACVVGPGCHVPERAMRKAYQHAAELEPVNAAREPVSLGTWWSGFNDPMLTKVVQRALDQNLDVAASLAG